MVITVFRLAMMVMVVVKWWSCAQLIKMMMVVAMMEIVADDSDDDDVVDLLHNWLENVPKTDRTKIIEKSVKKRGIKDWSLKCEKIFFVKIW